MASMTSIAALVVTALLGLLTASTYLTAEPAEAVDLELVLAVDASGSMDPSEQELQRHGYSAAFRHPEVLAAIASGALGRIAVIYVEWAGFDDQEVIVPWTVLAGREDAFAFADKIAAVETEREDGTSISGALEFTSRLFAGSGFRGSRRAIDVSGDGPNNTGPPVATVRDRIVAEGIVINGLPIMVGSTDQHGPYDMGNLDIYYKDCVIGGVGAFIIPVNDMSQLSVAIRRKLVLEIAKIAEEPRLISAAITAPRVDCLVGEGLLRLLYNTSE